MPAAEMLKNGVFHAISIAFTTADAYQIDRAGVDICVQLAIAEYLRRTGRDDEAIAVEAVIT